MKSIQKYANAIRTRLFNRNIVLKLNSDHSGYTVRLRKIDDAKGNASHEHVLETKSGKRKIRETYIGLTAEAIRAMATQLTLFESRSEVEFLNAIDWDKLREQKEMLVDLISENDELGELHGIVCLLDEIQDYAVNFMAIEEQIVFHTPYHPEMNLDEVNSDWCIIGKVSEEPEGWGIDIGDGNILTYDVHSEFVHDCGLVHEAIAYKSFEDVIQLVESQKNAEEDYPHTPISVLEYIRKLEAFTKLDEVTSDEEEEPEGFEVEVDEDFLKYIGKGEVNPNREEWTQAERYLYDMGGNRLIITKINLGKHQMSLPDLLTGYARYMRDNNLN